MATIIPSIGLQEEVRCQKPFPWMNLDRREIQVPLFLKNQHDLLCRHHYPAQIILCPVNHAWSLLCRSRNMVLLWTLSLKYELQDHQMRRRRPKSLSRKTRLRGAASASSCNGFSHILLLSLWTAAGLFTSIIDVHLSGYWICTFITLCTSRGMFSFVCNRFTAFAHIARVPTLSFDRCRSYLHHLGDTHRFFLPRDAFPLAIHISGLSPHPTSIIPHHHSLHINTLRTLSY